jgi:hypothetical protein
VVRYHGEVIQAFYSASDGGHTDNVEDAWHSGNPAFAIPYLRGVCDPGEYTSANPWTDWSKSFSAGDLTTRMAPYTGNIGRVTDVTNVARSNSGRIVTAKLVGTSGTAAVTGLELRAGLGLYDDRAWINTDRNIVGAIRTEYDDLMCAPGLPATPQDVLPGGAQQYFAQGGIFRNVGPDLTVWVKGPVFDEYRSLKGGDGVLGLPQAGVRSLADAQRRAGVPACTYCKILDLTKGRIYFKPTLGRAHALWGSVLSAFLKAGGVKGDLGFPATRVRVRVYGGTRARFQHGRVVCPDGQACRVEVA